jgi:hypothetical protein
VPIGQDVRCVRLEVQTGTVGIAPHAARTLAYAGGVKRAADTPAARAALERIGLQFTAAPDPADPSPLVVRAPAQPLDPPIGVFGLELGIHLPADLPLQVVVAGSGHVKIDDREARTEVETGRGDLVFRSCSGGLRAKTGRGKVLVDDHRGELDIHTLVDDVQAFVREPGELIRLVTGQGAVRCHLPPATEFDLDARAERGKIGTGFGISSVKVGEFGAVATGVRGAGTTKIVLRTGFGRISLSPHRFE